MRLGLLQPMQIIIINLIRRVKTKARPTRRSASGMNSKIKMNANAGAWRPSTKPGNLLCEVKTPSGLCSVKKQRSDKAPSRQLLLSTAALLLCVLHGPREVQAQCHSDLTSYGYGTTDCTGYALSK